MLPSNERHSVREIHTSTLQVDTGLKGLGASLTQDGHPVRPVNSIFSGPITHLLSMLCVLMKIPSLASAKKKTKRLKGFKFGTLVGRFQVTSWQ